MKKSGLFAGPDIHPQGMTWSAHLYPYAKHAAGVPTLADLSVLAHAGYTGVEGFIDQIAVCHADLRTCGLNVSGLHVVSAALMRDLALTRKALETYDCPTLVVSGPLGWSDRSRANWQATIDVLTSAAVQLAQDGRRLLYHNHEFEFQTTAEGVCAYELLAAGLSETDAAWCCDLGWVWRAQADPVMVMERLGFQLEAVHLRDFSSGVASALGAGEAPVATWLTALALRPDIRWRVVEADPTPMATDLLVTSLEVVDRHE